MNDVFSSRQTVIRIIFGLMGVILISRLFTLQLIEDFGPLAQGQSIHRQVVFPERGALIDRKGEMILNNKRNYNLYVSPKLVSKHMDTARLCDILDISDSTFKDTYRRALLKTAGPDRSYLLFKDLQAERVASLHEVINEFPGFELREHLVRYSPFSCGALVIGYTAEISPKMLNDTRYSALQKGDYVGISGLENSYEDVLRGKLGIKYQTKDKFNRINGSYKGGELDTLGEKGSDLDLYLDIKLQQYAEKLMNNKLGSLVAIDPKTGGIIAMVSAPSFDPNAIVGADRSRKMLEMLNDATKPMFNRATLASYAPGSTFKPVTALVALDEGVATASTGYPCGGRYSTCGGKIKCTHAGGGHAANLSNAMANSCNSYFCHMYKLAVENPKLADKNKGFDLWRDYMLKFGFGHPTGVDLPTEKGGYIPTRQYYDKMYAGNWNACNNCMVGMGQGEVNVTPLQMANAMCIIANKGYYYTPHFVRAIDGDTAHPKIKKYLQKLSPVHIADSAFEAVHEGMEKVVTNGTARIAKIAGIPICAKTGTVENYWIINGVKTKLKNHSMFVAFAPRDNPKIAIAVAVENSGFGATWAGPIASLVIEKYLTDTIPKNRKGLENKMVKSNVIPKTTYIIDSLQKQYQRMKDAQRQYTKDSLAEFNAIKDSIIKAKKAAQQPKQPSTPQKKSLKDRLFGVVRREDEYYTA
ncbi:MAG: penicillin-binding protein 2 [Bacteroidota bacterium]|jgi:penicillin-binding protein 2